MLILFIIVCLVVIVSCILYFLDKNKKIESKNVGKVSLYLETYRSGKNQPTHPDIIKFNDESHFSHYGFSQLQAVPLHFGNIQKSFQEQVS